MLIQMIPEELIQNHNFQWYTNNIRALSGRND